MKHKVSNEIIVKDIDIDKIIVQENVRAKSGDSEIKDLMQSIKQDGLQSPIAVSTREGNNKFILVFGSRRLLACKKLGWKTIPARVYENQTHDDFLVANLVENLHRREVTPIELGRICIHLEKLGLNPGEICSRLSKPRSQITGAITLYKRLPEEFRDKVKYCGTGREPKNGKIAAHTAHSVIRIASTAGLSKKATGELIEAARSNELSSVEIDNIAKLISTGLSVAEATKKNKLYWTVKVNMTISVADLERACKEYSLGKADVVRAAAYGLIKPLKRPPFIDVDVKKKKKK